MPYRVTLVPRAVDDLDSILEYIQERSPQGAQTWFNRWLEVYETLQSSADRQPLAAEDSDHDEDIRHVIFKTRRGNPYRCLFLIRGHVVHVLHIRGYGQNLVSPDELRLPK